MTDLLLNRCHYPVTVLGPGVRAGVWVQGCTIGCHGCVARDTWAADGTTAVDVGTVMSWLSALPGPVDGITLSGGEPFQQPEAVRELLEEIHRWRGARQVDILAYSGHTLSYLRSRAGLAAIVELCDAVVTGPYVRGKPDGGLLKGSANQVITPVTALGRVRYDSPAEGQPSLQVSVHDRKVYLIGIPRRGDLDRAAELMRAAGLAIEEASWRS